MTPPPPDVATPATGDRAARPRRVVDEIGARAAALAQIERGARRDIGSDDDATRAAAERQLDAILAERVGLRARLDAIEAAERSDLPDVGPWSRAKTCGMLLHEPDADVDWIAPPFGAPGSITGIASPRGLGKTHVIHALAHAVAAGTPYAGRATRQGRVLLIDRDNSRRELRRRLRGWCRDDPPATLEILTRDDAPALTDTRAWESFPFARYALVILDSLGAATEGVSEQDGGESGAALAPLLDLARRGPAVVVLLNVPKDARSYRGSGVIADRLDILYEVRDATDLVPQAGDETWWSRLPEAGEAAWADRARRRGRRDDYRLALVPSKFRIGEEPDPIALEVVLTPGAWALHDVTADLAVALGKARGEHDAAAEAARRTALDALAATVSDRHAAGDPLGKREAEAMLSKRLPDLRRADRRALIEAGGDGRWRLIEAEGKRGNRPQALVPRDATPTFPTPPAEIGDAGTTHQSRTSGAANMADRANCGRPYTDATETATGAAPSAVGIRPKNRGIAVVGLDDLDDSEDVITTC